MAPARGAARPAWAVGPRSWTVVLTEPNIAVPSHHAIQRHRRALQTTTHEPTIAPLADTKPQPAGVCAVGCQTPRVNYSDIAKEITANATALNDEVAVFTQLPAKTKFLVYGCLMACMGQIDLMSKCEYGKGEPPGGQTPRMRSFMERYLDSTKTDEHRVAIQLMRHTLMHTGELRYLYEEKAGTAYTWRVHFADTFPAQFGHYTLTTEDPKDQDHLLAAVSGNVASIKAFNVNITQFAADIRRVAQDYTATMDNDPALQTKSEEAYSAIRVQPLAG
jgi:hypothetical protein